MKPVDALAQVVADALNEPQQFLVLDEISAVLDLSVAGRVRVIQRHRAEWKEWESLFPLQAMAADPNCARRAKLAAEAIAIKQRGQSISHGLVTWSGATTDAPIVEDEVPPLGTGIEELMEIVRTSGGLPPELLGKEPLQPSRGQALHLEVTDVDEVRP